MKIGFTGTRAGMTEAQNATLRQVLKSFQSHSLAFECHHGDCQGADNEFADMCADVYRCMAHIVCHPPIDETHRHSILATTRCAFHSPTLPVIVPLSRNRKS